MIAVHVSAVCRVRDGYTGRALEAGALLCALDGAPFRPVGKPGGYLILVDLAPGPHRLSLRGSGFQEEWVDLEAGEGTLELDVTMKPGPGYPFRQAIVRLDLTVLEGGAPAAGRQLWLAAPAGPELKLAQTRAEAGSAEVRLFYKGPVPPAVPGTYLLSDGEASEVVSLRALEGEQGSLAAPLLRDHARGKLLLPAQSYHTDQEGRLTAAFREPCTVEVCGQDGVPLASVQLSPGEEQRQIVCKKERKHG